MSTGTALRPYHQSQGATFYIGDCIEVMRTLPDASVDSVVTDPPYGLTAGKKGGTGAASLNLNSPAGRSRISTGNGPGGFMGMKWDSSVPPVEVWQECLRVMKPGAHLLSFGGSRTYHRLAAAIEDAGFEIRDQIMWVYGSGFPKSVDISKAIDKQAGAEREVIGRSQWASVRGGSRQSDYGFGDGTKTEVTAPATSDAKQWDGWGTALKPSHEPIVVARKPLAGTVAANVLEHGTGAMNIDACRIDGPKGTPASPRRAKQGAAYGDLSNDPGTSSGWDANAGRWPANFIHDGSPEVVEHFPETASGVMKAGTKRAAQDGPGSVCYGTYGGNATASDTLGDTGSAARFFYCAKADKQDRGSWNNHPTVKPLDLMRYLCRLVTREGGTVLDPFAGSGTTIAAARLEACRAIGIELNPDYAAIAARRLQQATLF